MKKQNKLLKKRNPRGLQETPDEIQYKSHKDNMDLLLTSMNRDNQIKALETIINEIDQHVSQIDDTVNAKTNEFEDTIDRIVNLKNKKN